MGACEPPQIALGVPFRGSIRRDRIDFRALVDPLLSGGAVDAAAGREDIAVDATGFGEVCLSDRRSVVYVKCCLW